MSRTGVCPSHPPLPSLPSLTPIIVIRIAKSVARCPSADVRPPFGLCLDWCRLGDGSGVSAVIPAPAAAGVVAAPVRAGPDTPVAMDEQARAAVPRRFLAEISGNKSGVRSLYQVMCTIVRVQGLAALLVRDVRLNHHTHPAVRDLPLWGRGMYCTDGPHPRGSRRLVKCTKWHHMIHPGAIIMRSGWRAARG
jgi:hypothetical protein